MIFALVLSLAALYLLKGDLYRVLVETLPSSIAQAWYQLAPIGVMIVALCLFFRKFLKPLQPELKAVLIMLGIALATVLVRAPHLEQQFFKEDVGVQISGIANPSAGNFEARIGRFYPLSPFTLIYLS